MRATTHSGRISSSARHNDRDFEIEKTEHIDKSRLEENIYYSCYDGMSFQEAETKFYNVHFSEMMDDINLRAEHSRHLERKTNASKLLASQKTMPEEIIWQIGDKDDHTPKETVIEVFKEFHEWHDKKFGNYVKTLNWALHADEKTPHIHERRVWTYPDEKGFTAIGQHKALSQLGYTLPDPTKERGKKNNLKMVYSAECRDKWLEICEKHNLTIKREPEKRAPDEQNLMKNDFILQKQNKEISSNALALKNQETDLKRGVLKMHLQESKIEKANDEVISLGNIKTQLLENIDDMRSQSEQLQKDVQGLKFQKSDLSNEIMLLKSSHEKLKNDYEHNSRVILSQKTTLQEQGEQIKANESLLKALKGSIGAMWEKITLNFQKGLKRAFNEATTGNEQQAHDTIALSGTQAVKEINLPEGSEIIAPDYEDIKIRIFENEKIYYKADNEPIRELKEGILMKADIINAQKGNAKLFTNGGLGEEKIKEMALKFVKDQTEKAHDTVKHLRKGR